MAETTSIPARMPQAAAQTLDTVPERDTQPLWFRMIIPGGTAIAGNARTFIYNKAKTDPDLTNLEVAGQMPNTTEYKVSAIEIRPNANCTAAGLASFLANHRFKVEVGAKNFEKVNQPCVMFAALANVSGLNFDAKTPGGIYRFNPGEEIKLQPSQTFNTYFEADRDGVTLGASDLVDVIVVLHGQKAAKVAL